MAAYVIGQTYEYIPGQWGISVDGNGLFRPVSDPNAVQKETQRKADAAAAAYRIYNGDLTAIADYEKAMNIHMDPNAYNSWVGNRDQLDSIINAKFVAAPIGYTTKLKEAQGYADQAKVYAQQYVAAKAEADKNGTAISSAGQAALQNMYAWLKKETDLIGGGYNSLDATARDILASSLADGTYTAISYVKERDMNRPKTSASSNAVSASNTAASSNAVSASNTATTYANAQTYALSNNGMTEAATAAKGTDTDAYSVVNRATTQGMVGFNQGSTYDTDNRSAVQKYSQALQGNQLGTTSSNKSKNTVANRYAVSNIFR